jgi:hypothetical protein
MFTIQCLRMVRTDTFMTRIMQLFFSVYVLLMVGTSVAEPGPRYGSGSDNG